MENPYFERKFAFRRANLAGAGNAAVTITLRPDVGHVLTIERVAFEFDSFDVVGMSGTVAITVQDVVPVALPTLNTIWYKLAYMSGVAATIVSGVYGNEELNVTIEGGKNVHVQAMNVSADSTYANLFVTYRIEKRDARGTTHG